MEFIIAGYSSSGGLEINYGSNRNTHRTHLPHINGTVTYSVPFDPNAQYYAVNAQIIRDWAPDVRDGGDRTVPR